MNNIMNNGNKKKVDLAPNVFGNSNGSSNSNTNGKSNSNSNSNNTSTAYPYSRLEECNWSTTQVSTKLSALLLPSSSSSSGHHTNTNNHHLHHHHQQNIATHGLTTDQVNHSRLQYGSNIVHKKENQDGDDDDDDEEDVITCFKCIKIRLQIPNFISRHLPKSTSSIPSSASSSSFLIPILKSFTSQFNEPLNMMLLLSASISLLLNQKADAFSITLALVIVCLVASIQEYRSEQALEKLNDLVPHTCTVVRRESNSGSNSGGSGSSSSSGVKIWNGYDAKGLVVGDLIFLNCGDRVPADCRIIESVELSIDESSLTGENVSVTKTDQPLHYTTTNYNHNDNNNNSNNDPPLTDQKNIAFMGTLVSSGRGKALVISIGQQTEFGKIANELKNIESRKSPLQIKIDELGKMLALGSSIIIAIIGLLGWVLGRPFLETVTVGVSLAVAAIPEGLPICVTVTLALGVLKMAKSNAIVKKLTSVETLGCATVVASDKTGTLTQHEMTVRSIYSPAFPSKYFGLTGVGYDYDNTKKKNGGGLGSGSGNGNGYLLRSNHIDVHQDELIKTKDTMVDQHSPEFMAIQALFTVSSLCNNATLSSNEETSNESNSMMCSTTTGQPTEIALLVGGEKCNVPDARPKYHRIQEIPFSSERKRMEVRARPINDIHDCQAFTYCCTNSNVESSNTKTRTNNDRGALYFVKGMPESILADCKYQIQSNGTFTSMRDTERKHVLMQSRKMALSGLRVLAMAYGTGLDNLVLAGIVGMEDPPRKGVVDAVHSLQSGGVSVVMVTGDSKETAIAIGKRCGIIHSTNDTTMTSLHRHVVDADVEVGAGVALSGEELDAIPPAMLAESIIGIKIFYRVAPRHKMALVRAYQSQGEIVAMTGDGVNDAIALKAADIGVAMGKEGTDVAKEAADVVLADDDFSTIVNAVAGGKGIFFNIRNFLAFQLSTSFAALGMECIATILGLPNPLNAMQILWINIIMDGPPAQSLGVEPVDEKILTAKPRRSSDPVLTKPLLLRAITSAILILFVTLSIFAMEMDEKAVVTRRVTTMTFMTFVNCDLFNAYVCRSVDRCFYEMNPFGNSAFLWAIGGSILGQLAVIYFKPLQEVFMTEALSPSDIILILFISSSVLILDTLRKKFFSKWFSDSSVSHPFFTGKKKDSNLYDSDSTFQRESIENAEGQSSIRNRITSMIV